ncbi:MAG: peptide chain release factor N(5)-glutamine methyltransferase [Pseudomonadaceae bacterium]|nr:peptide chain release factor N(5)-glutamine methyltransferase [Pseudomonadaceae bacterium]
MTTLAAVLADIGARLGASAAPQEGKALLAHVLGVAMPELALNGTAPFPVDRRDALESLLARRLAGEPLAYVLGYAPFWRHDWKVAPGVLIPRPDTEALLVAALEVIPADANWRVAEVGVGSGALIGSLLAERPKITSVATDISSTARQVAADNLQHIGLGKRCTIVEADVLDGVDGLFDMIVSNPPYISQAEYDALEPCVRDYEPREALLADGNGLAVYRKLLAQAAEKLREEGWLMVEIGCGQAEAVRHLLPTTIWKNIFTRNDLAGRSRVVGAQRR